VTGPDTTQVPVNVYDDIAGGSRKPVPVESGMPCSIDSERFLLGAAILSNELFNEMVERLEPEDFSLSSNEIIFRRMSDLIDAGVAIDYVTLAEELSRHKELSSVGGMSYLSSLGEGLPRRPQVSDHIAIVKSKAQLRQMISLFTGAAARAQDQSDSPLDILEDCENSLLQIAQEANTGRLKAIAQSVEDAGGPDGYLARYTHPEERNGLQTGLIEVDKMTGGLQPGELTIIGARPSVGKSAIALNIAENVCCGSDLVVAIFSLEMSRSSLEHRFMASRARVDVKRAMEGFYLSEREKEKLSAALFDLAEARIFIDDSSSLTPVQIRAKCRRLKQREKRLDLAIVDYVQLVSAGHKTGNREQEIASISRALKALAKQENCPVIALAQLNRSTEQTKDKRPTLSALRESGGLEADADLVFLLHRDEMYDRENPDVKGLADLIIAKNRQGPTGNVKLAYVGEFTRFDNLSRGF